MHRKYGRRYDNLVTIRPMPKVMLSKLVQNYALSTVYRCVLLENSVGIVIFGNKLCVIFDLTYSFVNVVNVGKTHGHFRRSKVNVIYDSAGMRHCVDNFTYFDTECNSLYISTSTKATPG